MKTLTERMNDALAWIDAQLAICNSSTDGPWTTQDDSLHESWTVRSLGMYVCATKTNSGIGGSSEIGKADAAFIATARTGYPATLSATKYAILALSEIEQNGFCHTEKAMNFILTEIELLQCE